MPTKITTQRILIGTYILAVLFSVMICDAKFRALGFHNRDYALYLEFSARFLDQNRAQAISMNPEGENWLFMEGTEGIKDLEQSIHLEPVKYIYALIYKLFRTPYALFIFTAALFFLPLLWLGIFSPMVFETDRRISLSIGLLYLLSPAVFFVPAYDLRPYIFLPPFLILAALSVTHVRPLWEQFLWLNALFIAREEALILGIAIIFLAAINLPATTARIRTLALFVSNYLVWALGTFVYFRWTGYPIEVQKLPARLVAWHQRIQLPNLVIIGLFVIGIFVGTFILHFLWRRFKGQRLFQVIANAFAIGLLLIPLGYQFIRDYKPAEITTYLFAPRYFLHYTILLLMLLLVINYVADRIATRTWIGFMLVGLALFTMINVSAPAGALQSYLKYQEAATQIDLLWKFKATLPPSKAIILTDYTTHQAFYDFEKLYAYPRLPWSLVSGKKRYFPANQTQIENLLQEQVQFLVIARASLADLQPILDSQNLQTKTVFENETLIGMALIR